MKNNSQQKEEMHQVPAPSKPYSFLKYHETYTELATKVIDFFSMEHLKKFMKYDEKSKYQKEIADEATRQIREFLKRRAGKQFEKLCEEEKLEEKMEFYDHVMLSMRIAEELTERGEIDEYVNPFEMGRWDEEQQFLDQLQKALKNQCQRN